ncbi:MAG: AMP-binding protein [Pararhodobacter sp.]
MTIITSPLPDVAIPNISITQRIAEGIDPDAPLLIDGPSGRVVTGRAFLDAVRSLAGGLRARGFGPGKVLALLAPNCPEFCIVFHAAAWAGGTVTTINPTYTPHEVRHQLRDAGADRLVTVPMFLETARAAAAGTGVGEIAVIGGAGGAAPLSDWMGPPLAEQVPVDFAEHTVCLPYSSGTTGLPKGVMLTHRNLVANTNQTLAMATINPGEHSVAFLPFFHIYGLQVLMNTAIAAGGRLVTMPRFDLEQFLTLVERYRTPRLFVVPPVAIALAKHPMVERFDLSFVRQVNSGAAPLGGDVTDALARRIGTAATQGFGMTELSPVSHTSNPATARPGASGQTVPNTEARIVDPETFQDLPPGQDGELWIRGPQVMKGYLNNPEATAATIMPDGWLRTGDVAHFDADGFLYVTDRLKELIKVKGFQVAPAELEALLLTHPDISDAAVIGVPDDDAGEVPMAFITAASPPSLEEMQDFLAPQVAHYKQIRHLEVLDQIPKSASGKILRRLLRDKVRQG